MAVSRKAERELIRKAFLEKVSQFLAESGEEVLIVKSNEIAIPCVGCEGNEDLMVMLSQRTTFTTLPKRNARQKNAKPKRHAKSHAMQNCVASVRKSQRRRVSRPFFFICQLSNICSVADK